MVNDEVSKFVTDVVGAICRIEGIAPERFLEEYGDYKANEKFRRKLNDIAGKKIKERDKALQKKQDIKNMRKNIKKSLEELERKNNNDRRN